MAVMTVPFADSRPRIGSLDIVRGLAMVLMAIDHVRVYAGVPPGGPDPAVFLTRWVTHFCAPAFVFFAGTAIFLHAERLTDKWALSRWLVIRGAWLVLLELTFLRFAWTFNTDVTHYMLAGVIWMLGWCMILMALLVHLSARANAILGLAIMAGHVLLGFAEGAMQPLLNGPFGWLLKILYFGGGISLGDGNKPGFLILYVLVPWIGVMAAGYAFGAVMKMEPERRTKLCIAIGRGAIALFVVLSTVTVIMEKPWTGEHATPVWRFVLNARKYPASFIFLLMTLGPLILALPLVEGAQGRIARWLTVFGRVPLFYYLLHIPLIHLAALAITYVRTPAATGWLFGNHPMAPGPAPDGYMWSLPLLYLVTAGVVTALYFPCRWFAALKARRKDAWLSYL